MMETIINALGHQMICVCKHIELWGRNKLGSEELMKKTFAEIDASDLILVEFSVKGVGIGIESGYAHARGKTLVAIGKSNADLSSTLEGIAESGHSISRHSATTPAFVAVTDENRPEKITQKMKR